MAEEENDIQPVAFDEQSAEDIGYVVRRFRPIYERTPGKGPNGLPIQGFWAKVQSSTADGDTWKHTATEVIRMDSGSTDWAEYPDGGGRQATGGGGGIYLYASSKAKLATDAIVFVDEVVFVGDDAIEWWTNRSPGSVDLLNAGTNVVSATPFINLPTNRGTADILEFTTVTISGTPGANLEFKSGGTNGYMLRWHAASSKWVIGPWVYT